MAQKEHSQKRLYQSQCGTRNLETTDIQEEKTAETKIIKSIRRRDVEEPLHLRMEQRTPATTEKCGKR
jgi:hypothetical protein